jgi:hypothetical protein
MTIYRDDQGRPCLAINVIPSPASAHDEMALADALARFLDAPDGSPERATAADDIRAIRARAVAAMGMD